MSGNGNGLFVANGEGVEAKQKMGKAGSSFDLGVVAPSCSASSRQLRAYATTNNSRSTSNPQQPRAHAAVAINCIVVPRSLVGPVEVACTSPTACVLPMRQSSAA